MAFAQPRRELRIGLDATARGDGGIARGHSSAAFDELDVALVKLGQNLRQIDLAPILARQLVGVHVERIVERILRCCQQPRVGEVRWIGVKLGRRRQRALQKRGRLNARVAQAADQTECRLEKPHRRPQTGNLRIDLILREVVPSQLEERNAGFAKEQFGLGVVDETNLGAAFAQHGERKILERTIGSDDQRVGLRKKLARSRRTLRQCRALAGRRWPEHGDANVERRVDGVALLVCQLQRNQLPKRSVSAGGRRRQADA